MNEDDVFVALGNVQGRVHVAEAGGEDQVVAFADQAVDLTGLTYLPSWSVILSVCLCYGSLLVYAVCIC